MSGTLGTFLHWGIQGIDDIILGVLRNVFSTPEKVPFCTRYTSLFPATSLSCIVLFHGPVKQHSETMRTA
jgi:hypothetical protein